MSFHTKNQVQRCDIREYCHVFHQVLVVIYLLCTSITSDKKDSVLYDSWEEAKTSNWSMVPARGKWLLLS